MLYPSPWRLLSRKRDVFRLHWLLLRALPWAPTVVPNHEPGGPIQSLLHDETIRLTAVLTRPNAPVVVDAMLAFLGIDLLHVLAIRIVQPDIVAGEVQLDGPLFAGQISPCAPVVAIARAYVPVIFQELVVVQLGHGRPPTQFGQDAPSHPVRIVGIPRLAEQVDELPVPLQLLEMGAQAAGAAGASLPPCRHRPAPFVSTWQIMQCVNVFVS